MSEAHPPADPYQFRAPLAPCLDIRDPASCLALRPALALASELGVELQCLPFAGKPLRAPPPAAPDDDRGTRHRRYRALYQEQDIERYAAVQGIDMRDIYRWPDAERFLLGLLWLDQHAPARVSAFLQRAFTEYWRGALDVEAPRSVSALLVAQDQDVEAFDVFARGPGAARLSALRDGLIAAGVFATPSFVVEDEVFLGRAHLPMLRWILSGREGLPPI